MTTWRNCKKCGKIVIMSSMVINGIEHWKRLFNEEDLCKCKKSEIGA